MTNKILKMAMASVLLVLLVSCNTSTTMWQLESPDKLVRLVIDQVEEQSETRLVYSIYLKKGDSFKQIMDQSPLGISYAELASSVSYAELASSVIGEESRFVENLEFVLEEKQLNETDSYTLASGKKQQVSNNYNASTLTFQNKDQKQIALVLRAYNYGIAFSYHFPQEAENAFKVTSELTGFDFKEGSFWGHPYDTLSTYTPAYETYYEGPIKVGTEAPWNKNGWAFPILVESEGAWMMVSEAGFNGSYGASHLHAECEEGRYMIKFAEQGEAEGYYENSSVSSLPFHTPWRFIALGETPAQILETTLPTDLSAPSEIEDVSWIKPGRASWSWWSDNDSPQDYHRLVPFIDFAAEMGWEYFLVDANWNHMKNGSMEELAVYAESKNVGLLLWYNSGGLHNVVTEEPRDLMWDKEARRTEFDRISKLGIKGIKVDFFQSDKQEIIKQYLDILEDAADFKLLVNFHGCTIPKGWRRTWPNLLSMEAVRGEECYIFDYRFPQMAPGNMTILPFTRNAVGPVDYTPGGYSNNTFPHLTTFGFELALTVILETGIMHHADTPGQTLGLPPFAVDFLKKVPVVWDETKFLYGYPGKEVVLARRSENRWYIAGINGEKTEKEITIDLSQLGTVPANIEMIVDGNGAKDLQSAGVAPLDGKITIRMQSYGGFSGSWE